jgi:iron complex outermembrane recepter protein
MNRIIFFIAVTVLMFLVCLLKINAQTLPVTGIIKDAAYQRPVAFCTVLEPVSGLGTTTNAQGKFAINVPAGIHPGTLIISSPGYFTDTFKLVTRQNHYIILLKQSAATLSEVVVTGVSKATLIRENPVAVIAVSAKAIERASEANIIDVLVKNVPGLNAVKTGPNISKPFIRGLGYNRVLTLYDGMRQEGQQWGDEHGIEVDAYNIEKGEVIKGPASLIYGSDALAGVVSLLPAMLINTNNKITGKYYTEYQGNNGLAGNGLRLGYAGKHWAYALRGAYRIAKNYTNNIDGRVYNTGFRETNASASIKHTGSKGYSDLNLTLYNNLQGIPDGSRDSLTRKFTNQVFEGAADDITNRPVVTDAELKSYRLSPLHQRIQHYRVYSNNHYQAGKGDIDFLLGFQQNVRREFDHPTLPKQAGLFVRLNTFNYSFCYNAPVILNTEITIGFNGMYQQNKNKAATNFPVPDYKLFDAGGFIYAKWKQHKWTISGGIRNDIRNLLGRDFYTITDTATGFGKQALPGDTAGAYLQFPAFNKLFSGVSLSLGATLQLSDAVSLKANIARGYRAPGITEFASNGLDPGAHIIYRGDRNFEPEFSLQQDIGIDFRNKNVSAAISIFNNNISNYIYLSLVADADGNAVVNAQGNKTYQYQQAAAQLYGLEASLGMHPVSLNGFSLENAFSVVYGFNRKPAFKSSGLYGEYLPLIPAAKIVSSVNQQITLQSAICSSVNLKAEMDFNAAQNRYLALSNTETATPGYALFNFSVNVPLSYSKTNILQFQLQVNNIFDKAYQSNLSRLKYFEYYSNSPNGRTGMFGMGRNICVKIIMPFH